MPCNGGGIEWEEGPQKLKSFKNISQKCVDTSRYLQKHGGRVLHCQTLLLSGNWTGQLRWQSSPFQTSPCFHAKPSVVSHHVSCIFFGGMSAKCIKHWWAGCDGLNLLVCLNPITAWHLPWTSRTVRNKDSLISLAGLKLAQIYLDDVIILTISGNYKSISSDITCRSREECSCSR